MSQGPQGKTEPSGPKVAFGFAVSAKVKAVPGVEPGDMPEVESKLLESVSAQLRTFVHDVVELRETEDGAEARVEFCAIPRAVMLKLMGGSE